MNIKEIHQQRENTRQRIWLHTQYLGIYEDQAVIFYQATPALAARTRERIRETKSLLATDLACLAAQTETLIAAVDALADPRIQELMTRRYLNNQEFKTIAAEMDYDLRWVYRLHQQGLEGGS